MVPKNVKKPISVTLDPEVLDALQRLVSEGEETSISSVINHTMRSRIERMQRAEEARRYVEEQLLGGQPLTDDELTAARKALTASKARTAGRRARGGAAA
jgi:antitoxin ParD1/3/4